jgi:hypothetical protein
LSAGASIGDQSHCFLWHRPLGRYAHLDMRRFRRRPRWGSNAGGRTEASYSSSENKCGQNRTMVKIAQTNPRYHGCTRWSPGRVTRVHGCWTDPLQMRKWKRRRPTFCFSHHLVDVIAVEAFKRAHVVSQPGRIDTDEHHWRLALGARVAFDFARYEAKLRFRHGQAIILDQVILLIGHEHLEAARRCVKLHRQIAMTLVKTAQSQGVIGKPRRRSHFLAASQTSVTALSMM